MNQKRPLPIIETLAFLSVKHNIYVAELFEALVSAKEIGKTNCQDLTVEYRGCINHECVFLITKATSIIGQFRVADEFLLRKDICFENWMDTDKIRKQIGRRQNTGPRFCTSIQDLRHGMKKVNLEAEVLEAAVPSIVYTHYGNSAKVTNVWIADDTGKVRLCLWNEQSNAVAVGDTVQIKNATVSTFKGERQLRLGKTGTVTVMQAIAKTDQPAE